MSQGSFLKNSKSASFISDSGSNDEKGSFSMRIKKAQKEMPGVVLFILWCCVYAVFVYGSWVLSGYCKPKIGFASQSDEVTLDKAKFVHVLAAFIFGVCIIMDVSGMVFQVSAKKRQVNSLALFINMVSFVVYVSTVLDVFTPMYDTVGEPIAIQFFMQWMCTTPIMILVLASLGTSMEENLVPDWPLVINAICWDELMLVLGLTHNIIGSCLIGWAVFCCAASCFVIVYYRIWQIIDRNVKQAATTYEITSMRGLQIYTYLLWISFPTLHILHHLHVLDDTQFSICRTFVDVLSKAIYTVALMTGNFCILDTVATLRLQQMEAEKDSKDKTVLRAEVMNRALQMACVEAETSARLSRKFIANISHELRTPLNSVVAFNSLLLEADDLNSIHREYVSSSLTSAEALLGIINQVLEYAKLEAKAEGSDDGSHSSKQEMIPSSIDFTEKPFHLGELSDELSDIMAARVSGKKVDFAVQLCMRCKAGSCPYLLGDSFRLRQCLINLCDNAVKFCRDEGGQVIMAVRLQEDAPAGSAFVSLEVWDNGEGIPMDQQDLLFKPFSQLPSKHMSNNGGTGLGLAITKRIVSAMCGTIECVSNTDGRGTTFRIVVPLPVCQGQDLEATFPRFMTKGSLRGRVHLVLPEGPTKKMMKDMMEFWGMQIDDMFAAQSALDLTLKEMEKLKAALKDGREKEEQSGSASVLIIDSQLQSGLLEGWSKEALDRVLIVGYLDEQGSGKYTVSCDLHKFVLRPVKMATLYSKLVHIVEEISGKDGPQGPSAAASCTAMTSVDNSRSKMRILIVEDQVVNQKVVIAMLQKTLGKENFDVEVANNGVEGVNLATNRRHYFDLIIMDIRMPLMDGIEATMKIREWEKKAAPEERPYYIIAMTAHAATTDEADCLNAGMNRYTTKPLNLNIIREVLKEFEDWRSNQTTKAIGN